EILKMCLDLRSGLLAIGVNKPKVGLAAELLPQFFYQRSIAIRNGAIRAYEEQHDDTYTGNGEGVHWLAVEIFGETFVGKARILARTGRPKQNARTQHGAEDGTVAAG